MTANQKDALKMLRESANCIIELRAATAGPLESYAEQAEEVANAAFAQMRYMLED